MTDGAVHCVVLPLAPLRVGAWIDRSAWPLHVTLVPDVRTDADVGVLVEVVEDAARSLPPLSTTVGNEAWFGGDGSILVDLVGAADLRPAHEALLDALERHAGVQPLVPGYHRSGYRPHVTVTPLGRVQRGERLRFDSIALVELGAAGRADLAVPLALFDLTAARPDRR